MYIVMLLFLFAEVVGMGQGATHDTRGQSPDLGLGVRRDVGTEMGVALEGDAPRTAVRQINLTVGVDTDTRPLVEEGDLILIPGGDRIPNFPAHVPIDRGPVPDPGKCLVPVLEVGLVSIHNILNHHQLGESLPRNLL